MFARGDYVPVISLRNSPPVTKMGGGFIMRKSLTYKILAAVMALSAANWAVPANVLAGEDDKGNYNVTYDGETVNGEYKNVYGNGHSFTITGGKIINVYGVGNSNYDKDASGGNVTISAGTINSVGVPTYVYGGNSSRSAYNNIVNISGNADVTGGVSGGSSSSNANNNIVNISGGIIGEANNIVDVYGGRSDNGKAYDNTVYISGSANIENANLFGYGGYGTNATGNTLTIDGWSGSTNSVKNFNDIAFKNISWDDDEPVLTITAGDADDLANTTIDTIHIAGRSNINVGESMTLIESGNNTNLGLTEGNVTDTFTAGVALEGTGTTSVDNEGKVSFTVNNLKASSQAVSAAQTRAASAAFVNQGTDLISDSLDTISRDDNYGVKTFAAVHGNRSKYDVADDIKINGWSTIVGVGNVDKFDNGSEFSWGVFYENGSGNYRTYNSFNNEFFRGDGSMVYNGGGIAARYENKNGVYTEGSLRAGMLKNELDNAMRDINGSYGYETESAYYSAHIGVGKIISLSGSSDLDIYGKFFHTYTEGDSVTIAGDKFDFDSITSDRLRVGARITSNKENKFSTYYGLAYEYEFNGDADMTAQGLRADTQSLQGSSVMAELGFNYQPTPDSPWSFDLNMRGYTGERQGGSFNVQATYTF